MKKNRHDLGINYEHAMQPVSKIDNPQKIASFFKTTTYL
jgi:hypothetical protein